MAGPMGCNGSGAEGAWLPTVHSISLVLAWPGPGLLFALEDYFVKLLEAPHRWGAAPRRRSAQGHNVWVSQGTE